MVTGLHLDEGYCIRFPAADQYGAPLECWEDWESVDFLAPQGTVEPGEELSASVLREARDVLNDEEDGCHIHFQEGDDE